jgi:branched-chain amino acid aminotransferase
MSFPGARFVWKDGQIIPWDSATIHVSAHGLNYGTGVFEGIRCYATEAGPAIFRLPEHIDRLLGSAALYSMDVPYTRDQLIAACREVVATNELGDCYLRPIIYLGSGSLSLFARDCPIESAIFAWAWAAYLGEGMRKGARVITSTWRKFDSTQMPTAAKACGQYVNSVLAAREAMAAGVDEAILVDPAGFLAEGSGENLFLVKNGAVVTNGTDAAILPGITRASVLQIARDLGYVVEVRPMRPAELLSAEEVFFTGTAAEVTPVRELDGHPINTGQPGPVTMRLQETFLKIVRGQVQGEAAQYRDWLTPVAPKGKG